MASLLEPAPERKEAAEGKADFYFGVLFTDDWDGWLDRPPMAKSAYYSGFFLEARD